MTYRSALTVILALIGVGLMVFYTWCDTSCAYLKGDILGIDLKYVGMAFMLVVIALGLGRQSDILRLLLAAGIGVEIFLVSFQFREEVFCPFCLAFGLIVLIMYALHYEGPQGEPGWGRKILFAAGGARIPWTAVRLPAFVLMILGYLFVSITFSGSATPAYDSGMITYFYLQNA
jgi:hypothetical protein